MPDNTISGSNYIAGSVSAKGDAQLFAVQASSGERLSPGFHVATLEEVSEAGRVAAEAAPVYAAISAEKKAEFLEAIATEIEALGDLLLERAHLESGLPLPRLTGERGRTCGQLRLFAKVVREGSWVDARIDPAQPDRKPLPKPDIRRMLTPIGPVVVFGASNFPLAFSVAGGDTASALAAGCPVIVKAHPGHPGTSELVAQAINAAAKSCGIPGGVFSLLHGEVEVGQTLVNLPEISAVGFTGSLRAGRALYNLAAARPKPVPVYAEMGSINPLFLLPGAVSARGAAIAKGFSDSLTLGVGQFCTNPGLLVGIRGPEFDALLQSVAEALAQVNPGVMLTGGICSKFSEGVSERSANASLTQVFVGESAVDRATPSLFSVSAASFLANPHLAEELFGPSAIVVICEDADELLRVAEGLEGQLTTSLHFEASDEGLVASLLPHLVKVSGRVLANSYPTGVEVTHAMQHGGPYPATTDARSTSVGTAAILRFARPVSYQDIPDAFLPLELRDGNPRRIWRTIDGELQRS